MVRPPARQLVNLLTTTEAVGNDRGGVRFVPDARPPYVGDQTAPARRLSGRLRAEHDRYAEGVGEFAWVRVPDVFTREIPPTDRIFFARVIRLADPPFLLKFTYDDELRITRMDEG